MFQTRQATGADASLITAHRCAMFEAMGGADPAALRAMGRSFEPWLLARMAEGRYLGWITTDEGRPIASAGLLILDWPPHPRDPLGRQRGYILNVFVDARYRRRGLARTLLQLCVDEARRRKIRVLSLHASDEGRPLYQQLGFVPSNEMLFTDAPPLFPGS